MSSVNTSSPCISSPDPSSRTRPRLTVRHRPSEVTITAPYPGQPLLSRYLELLTQEAIDDFAVGGIREIDSCFSCPRSLQALGFMPDHVYSVIATYRDVQTGLVTRTIEAATEEQAQTALLQITYHQGDQSHYTIGGVVVCSLGYPTLEFSKLSVSSSASSQRSFGESEKDESATDDTPRVRLARGWPNKPKLVSAESALTVLKTAAQTEPLSGSSVFPFNPSVKISIFIESLPDEVEAQLLLSYHGSTHVEKEQGVEGADDTQGMDHHVERFFQMAADDGKTMVRRRAVWATEQELEQLVTQVTAGLDGCIGARVQYAPEGLRVPLGVSPGDTA
ncbi:hypothetical protein JCM24511_01337 [Saitozyma sp. JCM 24511]|nr:hypothetical protein JCM24511_01337 [Saitozyma sp. JCM 24511]